MEEEITNQESVQDGNKSKSATFREYKSSFDTSREDRNASCTEGRKGISLNVVKVKSIKIAPIDISKVNKNQLETVMIEIEMTLRNGMYTGKRKTRRNEGDELAEDTAFIKVGELEKRRKHKHKQSN